jgi:hypothetical protein
VRARRGLAPPYQLERQRGEIEAGNARHCSYVQSSRKVCQSREFIRFGTIAIDLYVVGVSACGELVALHITAIET